VDLSPARLRAHGILQALPGGVATLRPTLIRFNAVT
jgi:hypothetical protein